MTAGADYSIWRTGSAPRKTRTLATWLVSIPALGSPRLYLKTADPGEAERLCRLTVTMPSGSPTGIRFRWTAISAKDRPSIRIRQQLSRFRRRLELSQHADPGVPVGKPRAAHAGRLPPATEA